MNRRGLLLLGLRLGCLATLPDEWAFCAQADSLRESGRSCGLKIGVQAERTSLQDSAFCRAVVENFGMITPGNELKWARLRPSPDVYNFADADWMVNFAQKNNMLVHGHNLCWNAAGTNPSWFASVLTKENAREYLTQHITTVMGRYRGRIDSWDIVNEPVVPWSKREDGLYPGIWLNLLGADYIDIAFHAAAAADPKALRVLNIYYVEQGTPDDEKGRRQNLLLLQQLVHRGVPLQAVGIESHLNASQPMGGASLNRFLDDVRSLGLQVLITELDVDDTQVAGDNQSRDAAVAQCYSDYLTQVVPQGRVDRLIFWTASDRFNWMNSIHAAKFARADRGLHRSGLWDVNMMKKASYRAVGVALAKISEDPALQVHTS